MLTLNDGRSELWQWDTGRKLTVDADCSQVHFSNKVFGRSIDVDVIGGVATIPDILLQTDKELTAWAFVGTSENGYTKISKIFKVNKRNKPADYVFTPTEQVTLKDVIDRLEDVEENQSVEAIGKIVDDYLEENPVTSPVQSVNGKKGNVVLTAEDVGALPDDTKIPEEYKLPAATAETLGGIKAEPVTENDTQPVRIGEDGMMFTAPTGGGEEVWETIIDYTVPEDCVEVLLTTDLNGNPFKLKRAIVTFVTRPIADPSARGHIRYTVDGSIARVKGVYGANHYTHGFQNAPTAEGKYVVQQLEVIDTPSGVWISAAANIGEQDWVDDDLIGVRWGNGLALYQAFNSSTLKSKVTEISAAGVGSYFTSVGAGSRIVMMGVRY